MIASAVRAPGKKEMIRLIWIKIQAGAVGSLRRGGRCVLARLPPMPCRRRKRHGDGLRDDDADQAGPEHDDLPILNASFFQRAHGSSNVVSWPASLYFWLCLVKWKEKLSTRTLHTGRSSMLRLGYRI
jgi:hypothetical protein